MRTSWKIVLMTAFVAVVLPFVTASPAAAQEPAGELSVGYQFTHAGGGDDEGVNFPLGWYVDFAKSIRPMFQVVGEVSGAHKSEGDEFEDVSGNVSLNLLTFMGGVRVASHNNPKVTPFGQVLFGAARTTASAEASAGGASISFDDSESAFAMQIGGGVNAMVTPKVGVRVGVNYLRLFGDLSENLFRVSGGIVIPF
jgi:opacity protein-like surface antigen